MSTVTDRDRARIRELNDAFRTTFQGGRVVFTSGFNALPDHVRSRALQELKDFAAFDADNDPYGEHDFVSLEVQGYRLFAKIDYYDLDIRFGADDPSKPEHTIRVMTILLAEEY